MEYVTLNNGIKMPMAGIGVFMMSPAEAQSAVENALKSGVRLIDTANGYMNESGTGRGVMAYRFCLDQLLCSRQPMAESSRDGKEVYEEVSVELLYRFEICEGIV